MRKKDGIQGREISRREAMKGLGNPKNWESDKKAILKEFRRKPQPSIGHICPSCINSVFWAHREALESVLDISNTTAEDSDVRRRGMADAAFECLSFFDLYYDGCLHYKTGTLKDHEIWIDGNTKAEPGDPGKASKEAK